MFFVVRQLYDYLRPYKGQVFLLLLGILIDLAFTVGLASSMEYLIDDAIGAHDTELLWQLLIGLTIAVLVAAVAAVARDYLYAKLGTAVVNDLRLRLFEHLQQLSANFYAKTKVGDIVARFATDLAAVQNAVVLAIPETLIGVLGVALSAVLLFRLEWQLALITVMALPVLTIGPRILGPRAERASLALRQEEAAVVSAVQENIGAQPVVKAFGLQRSEVAGFSTRLEGTFDAGLRFNILSYLVERTPNVSFMLLHVVVLGIGVFKTFEGQLEVGQLVTFNALTVTLSAYVTSLTRVSPVLLQASGGVHRIAELLDEQPQVPDLVPDTPLPRLAREIRFRSVTFSYTGENNNLEDLSFAIEAGQTVAFVGSSGSGKSTVLGLLTRFYDPDLGSIQIDGRDLREGSQASLREQMAVVFQDSFLFNTTVADNIRMGRPEATQAEVEAAAKAAEIHDLILRMPNGYQTVVGERGSRLSGGQRQRVAIARAIIRDPRILVLDEATSALDPGTEAAIGQTLKRIGKQRTVVEVTHRLSSVVEHDAIFVLDHGKMVEYGTHKQLLARRGLYQKLWAKQSGVAVSEDGKADVTPERLKAVPILSELSTAMLEELAKLFVSERCPESRMVIRQGDTMVEKFYIIARGKVQVSKRDEGSSEERKLSVLSDGDHFGEIALLRDVPRTATIRTLTPCIFLSLRRKQFLDIISRDPGLLEQFRMVLEARDDERGDAPSNLLSRRHSRAYE